MADTPPHLIWRPKPKGSDLKDAARYLSLRLAYPPLAGRLAKMLAEIEPDAQNSDDVLRAFNRYPFPADDPRVQHKRERAQAGKRLSPILAVRWSLAQGDIVQGMHELSLAYYDTPLDPIPVIVANIMHVKEISE